MSESIKVPIKIHPRAFSAFGEDLITNENIAMIELVKNSYDAYALKVEIEFGFDKRGIPFISITDDGLGDYKLALNKILLPTFHHRKVTPRRAGVQMNTFYKTSQRL